jgi:hypothetical protein
MLICEVTPDIGNDVCRRESLRRPLGDFGNEQIELRLGAPEVVTIVTTSV